MAKNPFFQTRREETWLRSLVAGMSPLGASVPTYERIPLESAEGGFKLLCRFLLPLVSSLAGEPLGRSFGGFV